MNIKEYDNAIDTITEKISEYEDKRDRLYREVILQYTNNPNYQKLKNVFITLNPKYNSGQTMFFEQGVFVRFSKEIPEMYDIVFCINDENIIIEVYQELSGIRLPENFYDRITKDNYVRFYYKNE